MIPFKKKFFVFITIVSPQLCLAANGINLIGFGTESVGMGGADLAVARDTSALNTNPAGLHQIKDSQLDIYAAYATSFNTRHTDIYGNDIKADVGGSFIEFGYVSNVGIKNLTWGIGLFVQGGVGAKFSNMTTAFGTTDTLQTEMAIIKLTPGISWKLNQQTVFGVTALLTYAMGNQQFFPETSFNGTTPEQSFYGLDISDTDTFTPAIKLGFMHHFNETTSIGITYTSETELTLEGGNATVNFTALGLGKVNYQNATMGGLNLPEEIGIGLAHQINNRWLLAADLSWLNWRDAAKNTFLYASNPNNQFAPSTISQSLPLNWKSQTVFALGAEYKSSENSALRLGINLANNPVPASNQTPTLSAIATKHITAGYMQQLGKNLRLSAAVEYQLPEKNTYTNPNQPFGENAGIELDVLIFHLMLSQNW